MTKWRTGLVATSGMANLQQVGWGTHMGALVIAAFHSTNFPLTSLNLSQQKSQIKKNVSSQSKYASTMTTGDEGNQKVNQSLPIFIRNITTHTIISMFDDSSEFPFMENNS